MIFIKLLRLLAGYVCFTATNGFTERFINLCSLNNIPLWELKADGETVTARTTISGYLNIKQCAVRSGMRLKITSRRGMPFFAEKHKQRVGVLIGLGVYLTIISVMSSMIWTINISGNNRVTDEEILEVLAQAGLEKGAFKDSINAPAVRFFALSRLPEVTYITVNIMGSSVQVEVTERIDRPKIIADETPCDVVSAVDGQIAVLEVYQGTKMYDIGEPVRTGDVLAGGFVELSDGSVRFRHAEAFAVITTQLEIEETIAHERELLILNSQQKCTTLHFFGLDAPLFIKSNQKPSLTKNYCLCINDVQLPIGFTQEYINTYEKQKCKSDKTELALSLAENYLIKKCDTVAGALVLEENITLSETCVTAQFTAQVSAGVAKEMLFE